MPRNRVLNRANVLTPTTRLNGVQRQRMLLFACLRSPEPDVPQVFPVDPWRWEWNPSRVLDGITRGAPTRIVDVPVKGQRDLPTGGQQICPVVATSSARWWPRDCPASSRGVRLLI